MPFICEHLGKQQEKTPNGKEILTGEKWKVKIKAVADEETVALGGVHSLKLSAMSAGHWDAWSFNEEACFLALSHN